MTSKNLLVELLVEELPPKSLKKLSESFGGLLLAELRNSNCLGDKTKLTTFASPRRLAAHVSNVLPEGAQKPIKIKLMPVSFALDASGKPTPALIKKLQSLNLEYLLSATQYVWDMRILKENDGKAEALFYTDQPRPQSFGQSVQRALNQVEVNLPISKVMTYPDPSGDGWETVHFVRPAHRLVALYGSEVVLVDPHRPVVILGLQAGRTTQGHRFEAKKATLEIRDADSYETQLETEGAVIASFSKRRAEIVRQLAVTATKENLHVIQDEALLDEVTALVELPNVLLGKFEKEFLDVPPECLILTMKANQKYFPLLDIQGKLTNKFLIVSNITPADPSAVIQGNERVVRARLADAKFFFDKDRKRTLASRVDGLNKVVYHNKLGSQGERTQRVRAIAKTIAQQLGGDALAAQADQAAILAKADLTTDMVGEFPELQGIMGRYYAQHEGIDDEVAYAIEDHYKPRFAGDELPRNRVGVCVSLADKLETLVGMFGINEKPTGDKDPFALRRHALGVIRMLVEKKLPLELGGIISIASKIFGDCIGVSGVHSSIESKGPFFGASISISVPINLNAADLTSGFIYERLAGLLKERGYTSQEVDAVLSFLPQQLGEVPERLAAVRAFTALPEAGSLAAANKRVGNILKKSADKITASVDKTKLIAPAEISLFDSLTKVAPAANAAFEQQDYTKSLQMLAALKTPIDDFFDNVMVNVEDADLRNNRLALLSQLHQAMNRVADISRLAT